MISGSKTVASATAALAATAAIAGYVAVSSVAATTSAEAIPAAVANASASTVVIGSFKTPQDGTLITGAGHRSLYILKADMGTTSGHDKQSTCYGACASVWPPVLASKVPTVSGMAKQSLVGLTTRKDGSKQVTYNGLPLYYYVADAKAGESVGNHLKDKFGLWIGMLPSGKLAPDGAD
jgi:predicted lipoprotein with Yx(FWY)xxD motif